MPTVVADPLARVLSGIITGKQLADTIKGNALRRELTARQIAAEDQNAQIRDLQNTQTFQSLTRPVDDMGLVDDVGEAGPNIGGIQAPGWNFKRKAKGTVQYKTREGQTLRGEMLSPDEQFARDMGRKAAVADIGKVEIAMPEHLRALGLPPTLKASPRDIVAFARDSGQMAPVSLTPELSAAAGGVSSVPARSLSSVIAGYGKAQDAKSRRALEEFRQGEATRRTQDQIKSREKEGAANRSNRVAVKATPAPETPSQKLLTKKEEREQTVRATASALLNKYRTPEAAREGLNELAAQDPKAALMRYDIERALKALQGSDQALPPAPKKGGKPTAMAIPPGLVPGATVTLKDGRRGVLRAINEDGTIELA